MSYHLTYLQAVVTGLVQGVTELFPVSSLGHNVLLPALIGGSWAKTLNVSATGSPYLAFIVGLHVATAIAMIAFFWRDWLRIVRGFLLVDRGAPDCDAGPAAGVDDHPGRRSRLASSGWRCRRKSRRCSPSPSWRRSSSPSTG